VFTLHGLCVHDPADRAFTIGRTSCSRSPEYALSFIEERRTEDRSLAARRLVPLIRERFGIQVHPRSIERALMRQEKKRR